MQSQNTYSNVECARMVHETFKPYLTQLSPGLAELDVEGVPEEYLITLIANQISPENILQKLIFPQVETIMEAVATADPAEHKKFFPAHREQQELYASHTDTSVTASMMNLAYKLEARMHAAHGTDQLNRIEDFRKAGTYLVFTETVNKTFEPFNLKLHYLCVKDESFFNPLTRTYRELTTIFHNFVTDFMRLPYITEHTTNNKCFPLVQVDLQALLSDIEHTINLIQSTKEAK